jgi:hypothetical protein
LQIPVLKNEMAVGLNSEKGLKLLEEAEFIELIKERILKSDLKEYTTFRN